MTAKRPAVSPIVAALDTLDDRTRVTRGTPANATWIAAWEKAANTPFCPSYVAFLSEFGALRLETEALGDWHADLVFPGHAATASGLELDVAVAWLHDTFEKWGAEARPGVPVVMYGDGSGWPDALVTAEGRVFGFHRNALFDEPGDFEAVVLGKIEAIRKGLSEGDATIAVRSDLIGGCAELAPKAWNPRFDGGRTTFTRPADGIEIEVRLGDGRELNASNGEQGVFIAWSEPVERDLEALNTWNARATFVRASRLDGRSRFRGMLPIRGLDSRQLLELVSHDADLPLEHAMHPTHPQPTVEALRAAVVAPEDARELFARRWKAKDVRIDGDALVLPTVVPGSFSLLAAPSPPAEARLRARLDGMVEVVHRSATVPPRGDALLGLELVNRCQLSGNNLDLEPCVRGVLETGDVAALSVMVAFDALATPAFLGQMGALAAAIHGANFLAKPDPMDAMCLEFEARLGRPVGPHGRAMLEYVNARSLALVTESTRAQRFSSPWGTLIGFGQRDGDEGSSLDGHLDHRSVTLAFAVDHGTTSDDCPVIGIDARRGGATSPARVLAKDVAAFVSVLLLHTTGFDFDGDSDYAWRSYRSQLRCSRFGSPTPETELAERLSVVPAPDIGAVQSAARTKLAPLPSTAQVTQ